MGELGSWVSWGQVCLSGELGSGLPFCDLGKAVSHPFHAASGPDVLRAKARHGHMPVVRANRDVVLQKRPRLGSQEEAPLEPPFSLSQPAVDLPGTDGEQLPLGLRRQQKRLLIQGIHKSSIAFSRTDQGYPAASQTSCKTEITRGPQTNGAWPRLPWDSLPGGGPFNLRIAYLRWYLVTPQNSSKIRPFCSGELSRYRLKISRKYSHRALHPSP